MIRKIKNIKTSPSEEKILNDWKQVKSMRIKLLQESDWIFVKDSKLTEACIASWMKWRERVKKSKELTDLTTALDYLKALMNNRPELLYVNDKPKTIDSYKKLLTKALNENIKLISEYITREFGNRDILIEKFEESLRYKDGQSNYILIKIESDMSHTPLDEVANKSILNRQNYLKKLIKLEKSIHYYNQHIEKVESMEECDTLLTSIMNMIIPYKD